MNEEETKPESVSSLREQTVTCGLVLRLPIGLAETLENDIGSILPGARIVYVRWSTKRLYISDKMPGSVE